MSFIIQFVFLHFCSYSNLFLLQKLPQKGEDTSKSKKMSTIDSLNDLNLYDKNVHQYLDNNFFHEFCYFIDIIRRYRLVCVQTAFIDLSLSFLFLFWKLGSFVLIKHISEISLLIILITPEIFEKPWIHIISYQKYSSLPGRLRLLGRVTYSP